MIIMFIPETPLINETSKELQVKALVEMAKEQEIEIDVNLYGFLVSRVYGNPMESIQAAEPLVNKILESLMPIFSKMSEKTIDKEGV